MGNSLSFVLIRLIRDQNGILSLFDLQGKQITNNELSVLFPDKICIVHLALWNNFLFVQLRNGQLVIVDLRNHSITTNLRCGAITFCKFAFNPKHLLLAYPNTNDASIEIASFDESMSFLASDIFNLGNGKEIGCLTVFKFIIPSNRLLFATDSGIIGSVQSLDQIKKYKLLDFAGISSFLLNSYLSFSLFNGNFRQCFGSVWLFFPSCLD